VISTWRKFLYKKRWLAQSWRGNRLVKFIFGVSKAWNAPDWYRTEFVEVWCYRL